MSSNGAKLERVMTVYNTDYDAELKAETGSDVSAVQEAARAVEEAIAANGYRTELVGVEGPDLPEFAARIRDNPPQLVFNLCESMSGKTDNELLMPALLELFDVAYTGADAVALGLCLNKARTKEILQAHGVTTPSYLVLDSSEKIAAAARDESDFPLFLKLAEEDASIGIAADNVARDGAGLERRAAELLRQYRQPVICEKYIDGREVNVTVVGYGGELSCLPLHEIDFGKMPEGSPHIVSYAAKWDENHPDYAGTLPVPLRDASPELVAAIEETARAAFRALDLRDFGRVDLRVDRDGTPWVIDVNPNCDLSPGAGAARAAEVAGMDYPGFIGRICEVAWERHGRSL